MNERIENLKNWAKKHKKAIILTASGAAAGIGVLVLGNYYRVVPKSQDTISLAKDSEMPNNIMEIARAMKDIGDLGLAWENSRHFNIDIANVPLSKLGEAGDVLSKTIGLIRALPISAVMPLPLRSPC